jgi:hypothetical protein
MTKISLALPEDLQATVGVNHLRQDWSGTSASVQLVTRDQSRR